MSQQMYAQCLHCEWYGLVPNGKTKKCPNCSLIRLGRHQPALICGGCGAALNPDLSLVKYCPSCHTFPTPEVKPCFLCGKKCSFSRFQLKGKYFCPKCDTKPMSVKYFESSPEGQMKPGWCYAPCCNGKPYVTPKEKKPKDPEDEGGPIKKKKAIANPYASPFMPTEYPTSTMSTAQYQALHQAYQQAMHGYAETTLSSPTFISSSSLNQPH